jgi:flagellar protein FlaG
MESLTITPSTHVVSTPIMPSPSETSKVEAHTVQTATVEAKAQKHEHIEQNKQTIKPEEVTKEFNDISDSLNLDVKFAYNEKIDEVYISVTDKETGRIIRKLPTEEAMKIKESMKDLVGVLFDKKG